MNGRCSSDAEGAQPSTSWSRRPSFLARQQPSKITSADHVITVTSDLSPRSTPVASSPQAVEGVLSHITPSPSATALRNGHEDSSALVHISDSIDAEDGLRTPLLQGQRQQAGLEDNAVLQPASPLTTQQVQEQQYGTFTASLQQSKGRRLVPNAEQQAGGAAVVPIANTSAADFQRKLTAAYTLSWIVNIVLLVAKLYAYWISSSKAVLASAADSAVDLVSQIVIAYADWRVGLQDPRFPVGQARLEAIGVLACACIMSVASFEVISESVQVIIDVWQTGHLPVLELGLVMYIVLGSATGLKLVCWIVCRALQHRSDSMLALAEDHLNDIMSNMCAIVTAILAGHVTNGWWIDPAGAIAISGYIVARWLTIAKQQVDKIVGRGAPELFIQQLTDLANSHHAALGLDVLRAYHFGSRYIVEMEVVLPAEMTVKDSHDISLELQHKVEQLEEVERAFVHVDYMRRDGLEHKVERELALAAQRSQSLSSNSFKRGTVSDSSDLGSPTDKAQGAVGSLV